jgi:hypothetical protein
MKFLNFEFKLADKRKPLSKLEHLEVYFTVANQFSSKYFYTQHKRECNKFNIKGSNILF